MKIGITGANGHVGANLIRILDSGKHHLRLLQYHGHEAFSGMPVEVVSGDLNNKQSLTAFCEELDVIVHLAAKISIGSNSFDSLAHVNIDGTKNLVYAARHAGVKKFIHFSSIHALIHDPPDIPLDENRGLALYSNMAYERSKALAEQWVTKRQNNSFDVVILSPTSMIGPYDYKPSLTGEMILRLYQGKLPGLIPGGYNWVDVRDVCEATVSAIDRGRGGERYILSGTWKSMVDLANLFGSVTNKKMNIPVFPLWLARLGVPFLTVWAKLNGRKPLYTNSSLTILQEGNKNISFEKAKKELGFQPRPLSETLTDTVNWFKQNNYLS